MNRPDLFHGSMAVYGAVIGLDTVLSLLATGLTLTRGGTVVASALILGAGLYGLKEPDRSSALSDSWLAYLMAAGAVLVALSVLTARL